MRMFPAEQTDGKKRSNHQARRTPLKYGLIAATALSLCLRVGAWAEPPHNGDHHHPHPHPHPRPHPHPHPHGNHDHGNHDHGGHDHGDHNHGDHDHHGYDPNGFGPNGHWTPHDRPGRGGWIDPHHGARFNLRGGHGRYEIGERLPWNYRLAQFDWRARGLWVPPAGYYWAQVDNDFVLAALATGVVASVIADNVPVPPPPAYFPPVSAAPYPAPGAQIVARSGACLDVERGNTANGTPLILFRCHGTPNQSWSISGNNIVGDGGSCVDVQGGAPADGAQAIISSCNGAASQQWNLSNGAIVGIGGKCLGGLNGGGDDRTPIVLMPCSGAPWQLWSVE